MKKIFIDSDIFVRDLRYPRDQKTETNKNFLHHVKSGKLRGLTSIFNVLEVCGVLSFNYTREDLINLYGDFCNHFNVKVLFPADASGNLQYDLPKILEQIQKKQDLGDAQISYVIERFSDQLSCFVSWNARHFEGKVSVPVKTPEELQFAP